MKHIILKRTEICVNRNQHFKMCILIRNAHYSLLLHSKIHANENRYKIYILLEMDTSYSSESPSPPS